jgi:hypothetical protein
MTTINQLSAVSSLASSDQVPVWSSSEGDGRKFSLTTLVSFLSSAFTSLTVSSYVRVPAVAVSALPAAATAGNGARATVSDATVNTFHSVVVGGGSNMVPVFVDNGAWRIG